MMNLTAVYEIYGDEKALIIYKYFDFHNIVGTVLSQLCVVFFGNSYSIAMFFLAFCNYVAYKLVAYGEFFLFSPYHDDEEEEAVEQI